MATGLTDRFALSIARSPRSFGSSLVKSWLVAPAHPEPVPSCVRTVVVSESAVCLLYAKRPFEFAIAVAPACVSRYPVEMRPAARAGSVIARAAFARALGSSDAVASLHPFPSTYVCGPSSGIASGSSGDSFASRSAS